MVGIIPSWPTALDSEQVPPPLTGRATKPCHTTSKQPWGAIRHAEEQGERSERGRRNGTNQRRRRIFVGAEEDGGLSCSAGCPGVWRCTLAGEVEGGKGRRSRRRSAREETQSTMERDRQDKHHNGDRKKKEHEKRLVGTLS